MNKCTNNLGPFKLWTIENFPFIEEDFDAITNYQLYSKIVEYLKKIAENQVSLQESQNYVLTYFDNLDVQDEIDTKLDEMAESGELTDIIAQYLGLAGVLAFNTISDLSDAENIVNGSTCYTLGKDTYNDGKGGFYKIRTVTSGDTIDGFDIVALDVSDTLIAERMPNYYINNLNTQVTNIWNKFSDFDTSITITPDEHQVGYYFNGTGLVPVYQKDIETTLGEHTAGTFWYETIENVFPTNLDKLFSITGIYSNRFPLGNDNSNDATLNYIEAKRNNRDIIIVGDKATDGDSIYIQVRYTKSQND